MRRKAKLEKRLDFLRTKGMTFQQADIQYLRQASSAGKPHLANLMVKYGYAKNKQEAIDNVLNRCKTESSRMPADAVIKAILEAGGIPVWAHPLGGTGEKPVGQTQFQEMLDELSQFGLKGMECFYSKYPFVTCAELKYEAERHRLLISGGSDYHGQNKNVALGTLNAEGVAIQPNRLSLFAELT